MARENGDETMNTAIVLCKFCDGEETKKNESVLCNFCEFSRYEQISQEQDNEPVVSMESELKRLRYLTRRITGKDLDGASFTELELLRSQLKSVLEIVETQKAQVTKEELKRLRNQLKQAGNELPHKPVITQQSAYERRQLSEPMESEIKRLLLLNERMHGRKLEGMSLYELQILTSKLYETLHRIRDLTSGPITDYSLKKESITLLTEQERCSLENVKDDHRDIYLRVRPRPQEQGNETVSMESVLKRLRLLIKRMMGRDLDGLTFPELELLHSRLFHVLEIVKTQRTQVEQEESERMRNQKEQAPNELGTGQRPHQQDDEAPKPVVNGVQREYERRLAEPMETEFERLWLLNERMNGRKLDGMSRSQLLNLESQIIRSTSRIHSQKIEPSDEEKAKLFKELSLSMLSGQSILDEEKRYKLRFRPPRGTRLSVSRKLRQFQKRKRSYLLRGTMSVSKL